MGRLSCSDTFIIKTHFLRIIYILHGHMTFEIHYIICSCFQKIKFKIDSFYSNDIGTNSVVIEHDTRNNISSVFSFFLCVRVCPVGDTDSQVYTFPLIISDICISCNIFASLRSSSQITGKSASWTCNTILTVKFCQKS